MNTSNDHVAARNYVTHKSRFPMPRFHRSLLASALCLLALPSVSTVAHAEEPGPGWQVTSTTLPTNLTPGGSGVLVIQPYNIGAAASDGEVTVTDTLPAGLIATDAGEIDGWGGDILSQSELIGHEYWGCTITPGTEANSVVTCHNTALLPSITGGAGWSTPISPGGGLGRQPPLGIAVTVAPGTPEGTQPNRMFVEGGGASTPISDSDPVVIDAASPSFGLARWDGWFSNADGTLDTQAGSVPYAWTLAFNFTNFLQHIEAGEEDVLYNAGGEPRNIKVDLPPGLVGNPRAVPQCSRQEFDEGGKCSDSVIGVLRIFTVFGFSVSFGIYNLVPPPGVPAEFGFHNETINQFLDPSIRTGSDYGITTNANNTAQKLVIGAEVTIWGIPNDPTHNIWRSTGSQGGCEPADLEPGGICSLGVHPPLKPFLTMPTDCSVSQPVTVRLNGWSEETADFTEPLSFFIHDSGGNPAQLTGCNKLPFDPTISSKPTTDVADAPTGLDFTLHIPQPEVVTPREEEIEGEMRTVGADPAVHEAHLKDAVVTLPRGVVVNPASAHGLAACSSAQIGLTSPIGATPITTTPDPATCPDAAKIGSVEVDTPLLDHPIQGGVYVAAPKDNPFGSLLAIYIAVNDEATGTVIKLAGQVQADPITGQLTTTFANNPQLPFEDFHLNFFGGAHAALRTPQTCGTYETTSNMTPWSTPEGADAAPTDSFALTQSPSGGICPTSDSQLPNKPTFSAGTITPRAGAYSPFVLHLARQDGSQEIKGIDTTLPEGLTGKLAGISECSEAQLAQAASRTGLGQGKEEIASPSCPLNSEVGVVNVGAGAGPDPYYVQGHAYLAGPYKGAPLSLEIITPAVAGPYDLGSVAVRTALYVNPETTQIHAVSDPIPTILQGIPLDVRSINLEMNRNQFTLNPTSCAKKTILASSISVLNQPAALSSPFQVGECSKLGFAPKLKLSLKGATKRNRFPSLKAVLTYPKGSYANIARASVALPHSEFLEQAHIGTICTRVQFAEGAIPGEKCPAASVYGFARAITPLLDKPVEGPVYLRSSSHNLPDLVAALDGQIHVDLVGRIDTDKQAGIRNTFDLVPDAPVSKFVLEMKGGKKGLLVNSENICRKAQRATAKFTAQNGKVSDYRPLIGNSCAKKSKKSKKKGGRGGR